MCFNFNFDFFKGSDSDNNEILDIEQPKLPTAQQEALENLIKDVKWMILDEIAFALTTHAAKINEFTLKTVARHISSSHGKPGCSMIQIPLTYVFGHEVSSNCILLSSFYQKKSSSRKVIRAHKV